MTGSCLKHTVSTGAAHRSPNSTSVIAQGLTRYRYYCAISRQNMKLSAAESSNGHRSGASIRLSGYGRLGSSLLFFSLLDVHVNGSSDSTAFVSRGLQYQKHSLPWLCFLASFEAHFTKSLYLSSDMHSIGSTTRYPLPEEARYCRSSVVLHTNRHGSCRMCTQARTHAQTKSLTRAR